jgi:hypothetical protein
MPTLGWSPDFQLAIFLYFGTFLKTKFEKERTKLSQKKQFQEKKRTQQILFSVKTSLIVNFGWSRIRMEETN